MRISSVLLVVLLTPAGAALAGVSDYSAMTVGGRFLEVAETRQLVVSSDCQVAAVFVSPDGKHVAYSGLQGDKYVLGLARTSGGKAATLLACPTDPRAIDPSTVDPAKPVWVHDGDVVWSPDSKYVAFLAAPISSGDKAAELKAYVVVLTDRGVQKACIPVPGEPLKEAPAFSPYSGRLMMTTMSPVGEHTDGRIDHSQTNVAIFEVERGTYRTIYSAQDAEIECTWNADGHSVLVQQKDKTTSYFRVGLDGSKEEIGEWKLSSGGALSPDRRFEFVPSEAGLALKEIATGNLRPVTTAKRAGFLDWTRDGRFFFYNEKLPAASDGSSRSRSFLTLWMGSTEPSKSNTVLIARDYELQPSWSRDGMSVAYIQDGSLYAARLALRDAASEQRLSPKRQAELHHITNNAKQIAAALYMFAADWDDHLPTEAYLQQIRAEHGADFGSTVEQALARYLKTDVVFRREGAGDSIFRFIDPGVRTLRDIQRPGETIIGELDAGDGVVIQIYADGHVRMKRP